MTDPGAHSATPERRPGRKIPPLVWIILALLVGGIAVGLLQRGGTHVTPQGGTMPQAEPGASYMPPAPVGPGAPATPGGPGPNEPSN